MKPKYAARFRRNRRSKLTFGRYTLHPKYGKQFAFTGYKTEDIYPYLASGLIKGLGETLAKRSLKNSLILECNNKNSYKLAFINGIENKPWKYPDQSKKH